MVNMLTCEWGHSYPESEKLVPDGKGFHPLNPCPVCTDCSVASDLYKSVYNVRPHGMGEAELLEWYKQERERRQNPEYMARLRAEWDADWEDTKKSKEYWDQPWLRGVDKEVM
jgi:hypothetical protein